MGKKRADMLQVVDEEDDVEEDEPEEEEDEVPAPRKVKPKVKSKEERFYVGEIATQTDHIIVDRHTDKQYTMMTFLAKIGNDVEFMKKRLE